jgi:pilus assembly protein FimV
MMMRKREDALAGVERKQAIGALLGLALVFHAPVLFALGLGPLRVQSALDQPLRAEIELSGVQESESQTLEVALASKAEFAKAGVSRFDHLLQLKFEIARAADGRQVVQVSSKKAIKEPFLQFVIAAQWSGGRIVREYTALLDPPLYASGKPSPVSTPKVVADEATARAAAPVAEKTAKPVKPIIGGPVGDPGVPAAKVPAGREATGTEETLANVFGGRSAEYGPVEKGDTLWSIASQLDTHGANVNIFQILIALHRENPDAFVGGSIHRLKKGAILKLGSTDSIAAISKKEASRTYQTQLDEWLAFKGKIAQGSTVTKIPDAQTGPKAEPPTVAKAPASEGSTVAEKTAKAADKPAAEKPEKADRKDAAKEAPPELRIVQTPAGVQAGKGTKAAEGAAEVLGLRNQVSTLEESLASRERENRELRERVALLETQVKNATRLVQIENQQLAQGQQSGQQVSTPASVKEPAKTPVAGTVTPPTPEAGTAAGTATKPVEATSAPEPSATPVGVAEPKVAPTTPASAVPASAVEAPKPIEEPKKVEVQKTAEQPPKLAEAARPAVTPASKPVEIKVRGEAPTPAAPGFLDNVFGFLGDSLSTWTLGGLGALAAGLGGLMYYRRRRSLAEFQESVLMGSHGQATTTASEPNQNTRTDTSFLSDFGLGGVNVQADEVDPLAEAEVYLAYGRDEQAEEVLRDAAARNPNRSELKTKLLEIYKQRKDVKSFETLAEELYPASGKGDPDIWKKVAAMGRELNPENPLFAMELPVDAFARKDVFRAPPPVPRVETPDFALPHATPSDEITLAAPQGQDLDLGLDALDSLGKPGKDDDLLNLEWDTDKPAVAAAPAPGEKLEEFSLELPGVDEEEITPAPTNVDQAQKSQPRVPSVVSGFDFEDLETPAAIPPSKPENAWPPAFAPETYAPEKAAEPKWALDAISDLAPAARPESPVASAAPTAVEDPLAWDEAATKLELARAYMDMGDKVGARSILDEVIKEGNLAQQGQAKTLVAQLTA